MYGTGEFPDANGGSYDNKKKNDKLMDVKKLSRIMVMLINRSRKTTNWVAWY